jgi:hypothetical protein
MSVLTLAPRHWYSWSFSVADGDRRLAEFNLSAWREKGAVWVDGVDYRLYRESPPGDFVLQHAGSVIARATKPSAFRREFVVRYRERPYTLRAKAAFRRTFVVLDGSVEVGSLVPENWLTRRAMVTLPEDWPLPLKLFAMLLTIVHWKRDAG